MKALEIDSLCKTYANGTQALRQASLQIDSGDFFALLGANGAGKTTMIGIITGLVNKNSGQVKVFDLDIDHNFSQIKHMVGVVPQELNFNIFERCQDILMTQAGYFGIERNPARKRAEELLKKLGLWNKRADSSRSLSSGMKRRLMIARALMHKPRFLILDEPTAGVDVELRHGMWDYLSDLNRQGVTILLTTHYLEEAEQLCRNIAIIKNGEIIKSGAVSQLVQFFEEETFIMTVKEIQKIEELRAYAPAILDSHNIKVQLQKQDLHKFIDTLGKAGMTLIDIRSQGHRLERLFLKLVKE